MATVNEELLDASVSHQIGLQRLSNATVRKIIALLNKVDADLVAQIARIDPTAVKGTYSERRLEKLLEAVREINDEAYAAVTKELGDELKDLADYEAEFQERLIAGAVPVQIDIIRPSASQLYAAVNARPFQGRYLREWYKGLETAAQTRLRDAIRISYVEGETIDQMVRRVRGTRKNNYRDGILEINRRDAASVVRTAVNHTANVARSELYRSNDSLIKGIRWVSTLDGRTSAVCRGRDGEVYPIDKGPRPPAHMNCRSTTTPVLKSWRAAGIKADAPQSTRASMDGQVPGKLSYGDWLKSKPVEFQDDVLGKTKGQLFRKGGLTLDRFIDRAGQEYSLDELRRREREAFEKAGI